MSRKLGAPEVDIVETEKIELREPLLVIGFVGAGLVGQIGANHIIDQLKMKEIAYVRSRYMPPAVVFVDGELKHPFRMYADEAGELCILVCETPLRSEGLYPIASTILDWAEDKGVRELVVLGGIPVRAIPKKRKLFCAAEPEKRGEYADKGLEVLSKGIVRGIAGGILNECLTRKTSGIAFLTQAVAFMPDPEGAAALVSALNRVYGMEIEVEELFNRADEIKQKLKEVAEAHRRMRKAEERRGLPKFYT